MTGSMEVVIRLKNMKEELHNIAVFVLRKYGGEHLNAQRFFMIEQEDKAVLEQTKILPE